MTNQWFSCDGPKSLLNELRQLAAQRAPIEANLESEFEARKAAIEEQNAREAKELRERHAKEKEALDTEFRTTSARVESQFEDNHRAAEEEYAQTREETIAKFEDEEGAVKQQHTEARWKATSAAEASKATVAERDREMTSVLNKGWEEIQATEKKAVDLLTNRGQWHDYPQVQPQIQLEDFDTFDPFTELVALVKQRFNDITRQKVSRFAHGIWLMLIGALCCGAGLGATILVYGTEGFRWFFTGFPAGCVLWGIIAGILSSMARKQSKQGYLALRQVVVDADRLRRHYAETYPTKYKRLAAVSVKKAKEELQKAEFHFSTLVNRVIERREEVLMKLEVAYQARLTEIKTTYEKSKREVAKKYPPRIKAMERSQPTEVEQMAAEHKNRVQDNLKDYEQRQEGMSRSWREGMENFSNSVADLNQTCDHLFLPWESIAKNGWTPPTEPPATARIGRFDIDLAAIEHGIPKDERLRPAQTHFELPAMLPFPARSLLMLRAGPNDRASAVEIIQAVMLRMLTSFPAGKVRFTIIDPVGLGENFSAFMHLVDYDEKLVSSRIWTDGAHIQQRLTDLTEHMETVLQVYLRNEFDAIQEYNRSAGEIAEPYRVLVIANFPAAFSDDSAHRLLSVVSSGARCGVYTLMSYDPKIQVPRDFHMADLEPYATRLRWREGRCVWDDPELSPLPLVMEKLPEPEHFTEIVRDVGVKAKAASRVELPFHCVVPKDDEWWTYDSRETIGVPLGRSGAMKLQNITLGKGTSQHVLISGKTGSGKSTLLHAMITNLAMYYDPNEVELYLIDFKKGVEFRAYAAWQLPHARVIAIESEREFGLSVLQKLDVELRERGELFRKVGVQDLKGYRNACPDKKLGRVLLIIDEFQEFFTEDDRIGQDAVLLLDRLVRQGRAFGMHVLLGSQTLAGSFTLPRATIGQMAVRIALQCSEADAHLILAEDNTAARLLQRPGEAIYNDMNGLLEGNHPFQIVWLSDEQRDGYLKRVNEMTKARGIVKPPPIVFEGNVPADASKNPDMVEMIESAVWPEGNVQGKVWLGSAVAIKEPTMIWFLRQSGANVLMVGHREEAALGIMSTCLLTLASQHTPLGEGNQPGTRFYILDGTRPDAPEAGYWNRIVPILPHYTQVLQAREAGKAITEIAEELDRREAGGIENAPSIYLFIYNVNRIRDLRKGDDDFSYSRDEDKPVSPSKLFTKLLREGPAFGIHIILWCDTYDNLGRSIERQAMQDFELRVVFQMNSSDSSNLIDSPAAGLLGVNRAIFFDQAQGRSEKFRPYGLPTPEWLAWVQKHFESRPKPPAFSLPAPAKPAASTATAEKAEKKKSPFDIDFSGLSGGDDAEDTTPPADVDSL